jgi:lysophospholipase L1-like esterase
MTTFFTFFFCIVVVLILAEVLSRLVFRLHYGVPFHDRRIAEYPYAKFVERADPPLHYVHKKGFRSPQVNINRFGLRGQEPSADGVKRRILVVGESSFFGAKLRDERRIWSKQLERLLIQEGHSGWEVLNGGSSVYNSSQHRHYWAGELERVKPEILVVAFCANDIAQMTVMGEKWNPQTHWPMDFLLKLLERKAPWWNNLVEPFCLYFFLRRMIKGKAAIRFTKGQGELPWEACRQNLLDQYREFCDYARREGVRIAFSCTFGAYSRVVTAGEEKRLCSIQQNYRESIDRDASYFFDFMDALTHDLCPALGVPYLDLKGDFDAYPRRFECWHDLLHWNEKGMTFVADALYKRIHQLGWWD